MTLDWGSDYSDEEPDEEVVRDDYNPGGGGGGVGYMHEEMRSMTVRQPGPLGSYMQNNNPNHNYNYDSRLQQSSGGGGSNYAPRPNPGQNQTQRYQGGYPGGGVSPYSPQGRSYSLQDSNRNNRNNRNNHYENSHVSNSNNQHSVPINVNIQNLTINKPRRFKIFTRKTSNGSESKAENVAGGVARVAGNFAGGAARGFAGGGPSFNFN
jgi:hypothetical protein